MKRILILLSFIVLCCHQEPSLSGEFRAFWADTSWTLELEQNGKFRFITYGHFGNTQTTGTYTINDQDLELQTGDSSPEKVFDKRHFRILGDSCLVDNELGYDYCLVRPEWWRSRKWDLDKGIIIEDYQP